MNLVLLVAGLGFVAIGIYSWRKSSATVSWQPVSATITGTKIDTDSEGSCLPKIFYRYSVSGREYEGSRLQFIGVYMGRSDAQQVIDRYLVKNHVMAYVNPENHEEAVLEPGSQRFAAGIFLLLGGVISAFFIYLTIWDLHIFR